MSLTAILDHLLPEGSLFKILLTRYDRLKLSDTDLVSRFKDDIAPHRFSNKVLIWSGIRRPYAGNRRFQIAVSAACFVILLQYAVNGIFNDDYLMLHYHFADFGLLFGPFRQLFNRCGIIAYGGTVMGLVTFCLGSELTSSPGTGQDLCVVGKCWTVFLADQSFLNERTVFLSTHKKITLWKVLSVIRLLAWESWLATTLGVCLFPVYSILTCVPYQSSASLFLTTSFWLIFDPVAMFFALCFVNYGIAMYSSEMIYFAMQAGHIAETISSTVRTKNQLVKGRKLWISLQNWAALRSEYAAHSRIINFTTAGCIPPLIAVSLIWLYAASYLSHVFAMKMITFSIAMIACTGGLAFGIFASLIEHSQSHLPVALFSASHKLFKKLHSARVGDNKNVSPQEILGSIQLVILLNKWLRHEVRQSELIVRCGPLFDLTFEKIAFLGLECACYYLLTVDTIGIPSEEDWLDQ